LIHFRLFTLDGYRLRVLGHHRLMFDFEQATMTYAKASTAGNRAACWVSDGAQRAGDRIRQSWRETPAGR
jgi:hypothetical protein